MSQPNFVEIALLSTVLIAQKLRCIRGFLGPLPLPIIPLPIFLIQGAQVRKTLARWVSGLRGELFLRCRPSWEVMGDNCIEGDRPWDL